MTAKDIKIERAWAMPNKWTFTIKPIWKLIQEELTDGVWIDPFCGKYSPATIKNDLNPEIEADFHLDALIFLQKQKTNCADGAFYDPPYSMHQAAEVYKKYGIEKLKHGVANMKYWSDIKKELARIIMVGGKAICCGWNTGGIGKNGGFDMCRILIVNHGGNKNDTLVTVERKNTLL